MERIYEDSLLFDFYGELLTERRKRIFEEVVMDDCSLSEVAEEEGITRQGVHDMVHRTREALLARDGKEPTVEAVAAELGQTREEIVQALEAIQDPISLFEPVFHDGADTLSVMDQVKDESGGEEVWLRSIALKDAMGRLSQREQRILYLRFFQGRTQMEVAGEIHISQAQVSRLEKGALQRMRRSIE